ncbi:alpha/beta hydrolase [Halobacteriovorax sp. JY17]|uniref:alpha/beta hydrolase n=1 Tax=Halobacteriovorax sp. JY17 TaxID=2014617 RepID=UPI0025C459F2|nr:alpha/beta hydrolase [Halobacteriovorax sp. JY17]
MFLTLTLLLLSLSSMAETGLYISSGKRFDVTDVEGAMKEVLDGSRARYINIFIHGRGKHPEKGLGVISEIEESFGVKTIMFHWPSWKSAVERPVGNAISSAEDLSKFLSELNAYVRRHPLKMFGVKLNLLVHSMGNIVFKEMVENYYHPGDFKANLFSNLLINAADVPARDHAGWVDRIDFSKENYITYNDNDIVLFGSELLDKFSNDYEDYEGTRLGRNLDKAVKKNKSDRSSNAKYLNISKLASRGHRHYLVEDKKKFAELKSIFTRMFKGRSPYLNKRDGVYKVKDNIYYFRHN